MGAFERLLAVCAEDIDIELRGQAAAPWDDFLLNPRRLRGSDFLMRWSQGVWSEIRLIGAVNEGSAYFAHPYGPSSVAPSGDVRAFELYFEYLDRAGLSNVKRPDLLIFRKRDRGRVAAIMERIGARPLPFALEGHQGQATAADLKLPFIPEDDPDMQALLQLAVVGVECENSLWVAREMPDYGRALRPMARLGGADGLPKNAVLPNIIIKDEDRGPLTRWQEERGIPIHVWHVFYDMAFGIALTRAEELFEAGLIEPKTQTYQAPGGAVTRKTIYQIYYHYAYRVGVATEEPSLVASYIKDGNGHVLPYVRFEGGKLVLLAEVIQVLDAQAAARFDT